MHIVYFIEYVCLFRERMTESESCKFCEVNFDQKIFKRVMIWRCQHILKLQKTECFQANWLMKNIAKLSLTIFSHVCSVLAPAGNLKRQWDGATTFSIMAFSTLTFGLMTYSITKLNINCNTKHKWHSA